MATIHSYIQFAYIHVRNMHGDVCLWCLRKLRCHCMCNETQYHITTSVWDKFDHSSAYIPDFIPSNYHIIQHLKFFFADNYKDDFKQLVKIMVLYKWHIFTMKWYNNCWCLALTNASTMTVTMSKSSVRFVQQISIEMIWKYFLFPFNILLKLTF